MIPVQLIMLSLFSQVASPAYDELFPKTPPPPIVSARIISASDTTIKPCQAVTWVFEVVLKSDAMRSQWPRVAQDISQRVRLNGVDYIKRLGNEGALNEACTFEVIWPQPAGPDLPPNSSIQALIAAYCQLNARDRTCLFLTPGEYSFEFFFGERTLSTTVHVVAPTPDEQAIIEKLNNLPVLLFLANPRNHDKPEFIALVESLLLVPNDYSPMLSLTMGLAKSKHTGRLLPAELTDQARHDELATLLELLRPVLRCKPDSKLIGQAAFQFAAIAARLSTMTTDEQARATLIRDRDAAFELTAECLLVPLEKAQALNALRKIQMAAQPAKPMTLKPLLKLVPLEGQEYVTLRNQLLGAQTGHYDVVAAAEISWEVGLAAYVLNQRWEFLDDFVTCDQWAPGSTTVTGVTYRRLNRIPASAAFAFLLEKAWKGTPAEKKAGYGDLKYGSPHLYPEGSNHPAHLQLPPGALFRAMWAQAPDEDLKTEALRRLAQAGDPQDAPILEDVLTRPDRNVLYRAGICLSNLAHVHEPFVVKLVAKYLAVECPPRETVCEPGFEQAMRALAYNPDPRARLFMQQNALNRTLPITRRIAALRYLGPLADPEDGVVFQQFMLEVLPLPARLEAIGSLAFWSATVGSAMLVSLLDPVADPRVLERTLKTLHSMFNWLANPLYGVKRNDVPCAEEIIPKIQRIADDESLSPALRHQARDVVYRVQSAIEYMEKQARTPFP